MRLDRVDQSRMRPNLNVRISVVSRSMADPPTTLREHVFHWEALGLQVRLHDRLRHNRSEAAGWTIEGLAR